MSGNASNHCAVMRNPFSTAVASAKIPDGAATLSTSCRYSSSRALQSKTGSMVLLLNPGFFTGLVTLADGNVHTTNKFDIPSRRFGYNGDNNVISFSANDSTPESYRIVSQGLRLALINNSLDNDGWFEAIRVDPSYDLADYQIVFPTGDLTNAHAQLAIERFEGKLITDGTVFPEWSMNPSYIAGKVRDIHKHTFCLHRGEGNEFIVVPQKCTLLPNGGLENLEGSGTDRAANVNREIALVNFFNDTHMDCICIRIHASASEAAPLSLHAHMVQHVEERYDSKSDLARFMTIPPVNRRLTESTLSVIKRDIKPSMIRAPTGGVPVTYNKYSKRRKRRYA